MSKEQIDFPHNERAQNQDAVSEKLLAESHSLADTIRDTYAEHFQEAIRTYRKEIGDFPKTIENYLENKDWFKPGIEILTSDGARKRLSELDFQYDADSWIESEVLMVFNLPKPLGQYWNKSGIEEHPQQMQSINGMTVEWGFFYRTLANIPWDSVGQTIKNNERMEILRINNPGEHRKDFYYLFRITEYTPEEWGKVLNSREEIGLELENSMKVVFENLKISFSNQKEIGA